MTCTEIAGEPKITCQTHQFLGEDAIPVVDHETIGMIVWKRLPELLQGPLRRRVVGDVMVEDPTGAQLHNHKNI